MKRKYLILVAGFLVVLLVLFSYSRWNMSDPSKTCAQCHEVSPSHTTWLMSAHSDIHCIECHGTALSNGVHSAKEKMRMVFTHFSGDKYHSDIRLTEKQALDIHDRCVVCHQAEYAGWLASGHAVNYKEIFMDEEHNRMEKPYWDCLRCHGMFYDGNIHDLMSLEGDEPSGWHIKDRKQEALPTIPCLACHQIHTDNSVSERYVSMIDSSRFTKVRHPRTALYVRADKMHLRSDYLTKVTMIDDDGRVVESSGEPNNLLCMQCHSPDNNHHAGSQDDRTPTGVHEGISCIACHKPHTGNARETCFDCHSSLTTQEIEAVYRNPHHFNVEK